MPDTQDFDGGQAGRSPRVMWRAGAVVCSILVLATWFGPGVAPALATLPPTPSPGSLEPSHVTPALAGAAFTQGVEHFRARRLPEAVAAFERCVELRPEHREAWLNLGSAWLLQRRFERSAEAFRRAIELDGRDVIAVTALAKAYEQQGELEDALEQWERAVEIAAADAGLHLALGRTLARLGELTSAVDAYKEALRLEPGLASAWFNLGRAYARLGELAEEASERRRLTKQQQEAYTQTVTCDPSFAKAWYNLAITYFTQGRVADEIGALESAVRARPDYPGALYNLAHAYEGTGDQARALKTWTKYIRVSETDPAERKFVLEARKHLERLDP
uniref:Tetratricopeptide repeat-TPR protein n=1 Tax=uncultured delta proteobacterium DeepAnt-32C6 TaxID=357895 RepID=Q2I6L6_9DELT|nr:Tetratricopeptide repeat-TPR protein [uncultured delta proteobacterium DeepAnt-32C6]